MGKNNLKAKPGSTLWRIGLWATIWWGVSGAYLVLLVWQSRDAYADISTGSSASGFFSDWWSAIIDSYANSNILLLLLILVIVGWLISVPFWLAAIKRARISFEAAFKDLFLTLRK